jgi:hypothetical protein
VPRDCSNLYEPPCLKKTARQGMARALRRRTLRSAMEDWVHDYEYGHVQRRLRGNSNGNSNRNSNRGGSNSNNNRTGVNRTGRQVNRMEAWFALHAARAPSAPLGLPDRLRSTRMLYRGLHATRDILAELEAGGLHDPGFSAFAFTAGEAVEYAETAGVETERRGSPVLLRLRVDRIPRGTPWAWYLDSPAPRRRNRHIGVGPEQVLLPPGVEYRVLRRTRGQVGSMRLRVYDVEVVDGGFGISRRRPAPNISYRHAPLFN